MQKVIALITLIILTMSPVFGLTLEGGVTYTVESARKEAFSGVKYKIPVSSFKKYMQDPNFEENKAAIAAGKADLGDRWVEAYSDLTYGILFKNDRYRVYYYDKSGHLTTIGIRSSLVCPMKSYAYNLKGELESVSFYQSANNIYTYDFQGNLLGHRINDVVYDADGNEILKRIK